LPPIALKHLIDFQVERAFELEAILIALPLISRRRQHGEHFVEIFMKAAPCLRDVAVPFANPPNAPRDGLTQTCSNPARDQLRRDSRPECDDDAHADQRYQDA